MQGATGGRSARARSNSRERPFSDRGGPGPEVHKDDSHPPGPKDEGKSTECRREDHAGMEGQEPGWPPLMHSCPPLQGLAEYRRLRFACSLYPPESAYFAFLDRLGRVEVPSESSQLKKKFPSITSLLLPHLMRRVTHHRAHSRHPDKFITPMSHPTSFIASPDYQNCPDCSTLPDCTVPLFCARPFPRS